MAGRSLSEENESQNAGDSEDSGIWNSIKK